jgi:hypothetical protein
MRLNCFTGSDSGPWWAIRHWIFIQPWARRRPTTNMTPLLKAPPAAPAAPVRTLPSQCVSLLAQAWIFHKGNWTLCIPALLGSWRPRSWEMSSRNWRSAIRNNIASCFASQGSKSGSQLQVDGINTLAYYHILTYCRHLPPVMQMRRKGYHCTAKTALVDNLAFHSLTSETTSLVICIGNRSLHKPSLMPSTHFLPALHLDCNAQRCQSCAACGGWGIW